MKHQKTQNENINKEARKKEQKIKRRFGIGSFSIPLQALAVFVFFLQVELMFLRQEYISVLFFSFTTTSLVFLSGVVVLFLFFKGYKLGEKYQSIHHFATSGLELSLGFFVILGFFYPIGIIIWLSR